MNEFGRKLKDAIEWNDYIATFADPSREILLIDNYTYSIDGNTLSAPITATAPQTFNVPMDTDSDFVCTYFSGYGRAQGATNLTANPAMMVQVRDKATGKTFFNQPSPMPMVCGQGGFPLLLTSPRVIHARSTIEVVARSARVQSFSGFYFCLHGSRIFYGSGGRNGA